MKTKKILTKIKTARKAIGIADSALNSILTEILPFLDFDAPEANFFHVENSTDGIVLADSWAKIYHLGGILAHIETKGSFKSYSEVLDYSI